jgi:hypothetical protein
VYLFIGMAYGRNFYPDQRVFVGEAGASTEELHGVQSFDGSWERPYESMNVLGYGGFVGNAMTGPLVGNVSISRLIVDSNDPVTGMLETPISGYLVYGPDQSNGEFFNFKSAYIDSYESSCAIGEVVSNDITMTAYGEIGKINSETPSSSSITATPAIASNISLTAPFGSTNCIQSYSLNINIDRTDSQLISQFYPTGFFTTFPIVVSLDFDMKVKDYEVENIYDLICSNPTSDLRIDLETCEGSGIRSFHIESGELIGSAISAGIGDDMTVSLRYEAFYGSVSGVEQIFS